MQGSWGWMLVSIIWDLIENIKFPMSLLYMSWSPLLQDLNYSSSIYCLCSIHCPFGLIYLIQICYSLFVLLATFSASFFTKHIVITNIFTMSHFFISLIWSSDIRQKGKRNKKGNNHSSRWTRNLLDRFSWKLPGNGESPLNHKW